MVNAFHFEFKQDISRGPRSNIFTLKDHAVVREAVATLQGIEHSVIILRFWEGNTISEISEILDLSWGEVEKNITQALLKLKEYCVKNQDFSRTIMGGMNQCGTQKLLSGVLSQSNKAA